VLGQTIEVAGTALVLNGPVVPWSRSGRLLIVFWMRVFMRSRKTSQPMTWSL
jgi:hypothetical protein